RRPARPRRGGRPGGARRRDLRQRRGRRGLREQDPRRARRARARPLLGPPGGRGRPHERPLHGREDGGARGRVGPRRDLSRGAPEPGRAAPPPPRQGGGRRDGKQRRRKPEGRDMSDAQLDELSINTIRTLSMDAVQAAQSGHPGTPMALAPLVCPLWNRVLRFDPQDPIWANRDRFVLSNGHASMLLWALLHLTGTRAVNADYERLGEPAVSLDDIRRFRQLGSHAPGHPEYHWVSGVETPPGRLGQGMGASGGRAMGERWLAARSNRPGFEIFDYAIYAVCGDGCLMEGVGNEAASLAGHLGLDNLCWIY